MIGILTVVRLYLIVVLMCIFQIITDFKHLFIYLLVISKFSLEKWLFKSFAQLYLGCFFLQLNCKSSLYILYINSLSVYGLQIFSSILKIAFSLYWLFFCYAEAFEFDAVAVVYFCFCWLYFWCHIQEIIIKTNVMKIFPYVFI